MTRILPILVAFEIFIELTQPGGNKVWIEESHITLFKAHMGNCRGNTVVITAGAQPLCVMETADEIRHKIDETKK